MATYTPTVTPRLRMMRNTPLYYDRSGQTASTSEPGPSRLPEFSQLIDVNLNDIAMSDTTDQPNGSRASTPSTVTRPETPAAKLRALLLSLPQESASPARPQSPSQQFLSERESDYDISEPASATTSRVQESLKDIFSKARRDPDTPQNSRHRHNSASISDADLTPKLVKNSSISKGKQRSISDDDMDQPSQSTHMNKTATRSKISPQPVTKEFLRERFSDSFVSPEDVGRLETSTQRTGNQTLLHDLDSTTASPPMATSTPQQSLRMSVNSRFHSNLLESDTEMQHAIDGLDEYDDVSNRRSMSPPPTLRKGSKPSSEKYSSSLRRRQSGSGYDLHRTPSQFNARSKYAQDEQNKVDEVEMSLKSDLDWDKSRSEREGHRRDHVRDQEELDEVEDSLKVDLELDKSRSRREWESQGGQADDQEEIDEVEVSLKTDIQWDKSRSRHEWQNSYARTDTHPQRSTTLSSMELTAPLGGTGPISHNIRTIHSIDVDENEDSRQYNNYVEDHSSHSRQHLTLSRTRPQSQSLATNFDEASVESQEQLDDQRDSPHPSRQLKPNRHSSLTPRPLSPAVSRGLDDFDMSYQSKDENRHPQGKKAAMGSRNLKNSSMQPHESTRSPNSTSSLQTIENTYMHEDPNLRHHSRPSSPLPLTLQIRTASPVIPSVVRKQKNSFVTPLASNRHASPQSIHSQRQAESPMEGERRPTGDTDDLRDTDFSSRDGTLSDASEEEDQISEHDTWSSTKQTPSRFSTPSTVPPTITQNTLHSLSSEPLLTSTPPRRPSSRNSRRNFATPSPPKTLPDLPIPSSSEESDHNSSQNHVTPMRVEKTPQDSTWLKTPRPPGAWAQTPRPSRNPPSDSESEHRSSSKAVMGKGKSKQGDDIGLSYPQTPMNRNDRPTSNILDTVGKTPRPPGGWLSTPAPISSVTAEARIAPSGNSEQKIGLLTPTASISKGASFDPQTPAVPGGWLATPAIRKSILKVRFDSHQVGNSSNQKTDLDTTNESEYQTPSHPSTRPSYQAEEPRLPPSPSSPRKSRVPNIRVVDAFGREQGSVGPENGERCRSLVHVVDSLGRAVEQSEQSPTEDPSIEIKYSSRGELLKHIRRGLDDLAEDFDNQVKDDDEVDADRARIEELNSLSKQARKARERLRERDQSARSDSKINLAIQQQFSKPSSWWSSRRFWFTVTLVNLTFLIFIFRISEYWAKQRYLNSYYDPFNPELYLYVSKSDHSLYLLDDNLSRTSWASYARTLLGGGRKTWYDWLRVTREIQSYLWNIWTNDSRESPVPRNDSTWLPS